MMGATSRDQVGASSPASGEAAVARSPAPSPEFCAAAGCAPGKPEDERKGHEGRMPAPAERPGSETAGGAVRLRHHALSNRW